MTDEVWIGRRGDELLNAMQGRARCWRDLAVFVKSDWRTLSEWHQGKRGLEIDKAAKIFWFFKMPFEMPSKPKDPSGPLTPVPIQEIRKKVVAGVKHTVRPSKTPQRKGVFKAFLTTIEVERVKEEMERQGIAINKLATIMGCKRFRLERWMSRQVEVSKDIRRKLLNAVGLTDIERGES